jgi:aspartate racemase
MRKPIGLLGGVGYATTIEYYGRIMRKYQAQVGDLDLPEMVVYSLSHGPFKRYEDARDTDAYVSYIMQGIRALVAAGADFVALAANSPHMVLDQLRGETPVPIISALDSAVHRAIELRMTRALLMGIRFTMQSTFFQDRFAKEHITLVAPSSEDQEVIQRIIDEELVRSVINPNSRNRLLEIVSRHQIDGVVLGCMRLPLILSDGMNGVRFVDTLDLHTTDILTYALAEN